MLPGYFRGDWTCFAGLAHCQRYFRILQEFAAALDVAKQGHALFIGSQWQSRQRVVSCWFAVANVNFGW
jgi:hypothetical protein